MSFSELNFSLLLFFTLFFIFCLNSSSLIQALIIAELIWITLYVIALLTGFLFDDINILSLTFFFLIFSAIELGAGLILALLQHIFTRSSSFSTSDKFIPKSSSRLSPVDLTPRIRWKI